MYDFQPGGRSWTTHWNVKEAALDPETVLGSRGRMGARASTFLFACGGCPTAITLERDSWIEGCFPCNCPRGWTCICIVSHDETN